MRHAFPVTCVSASVSVSVSVCVSVSVSVAVSVAALTLSSILSGCGRSEPAAAEPLLCYVGGTMRPVLEELAAVWEKEAGRRVEIDYGDSGSNLVKIQTTRRGDVNVCHDPFQAALAKQGLTIEAHTVALLTPAIAVPKGNPRGIRGLEDLGREGVRLGLTDESYSTLGYICPVMFRRAGILERIEKNVATRMRMGGQVANAVIQGHLDAAIVWDAVIHARRESLDRVPIDPRHLPDPTADAVTSATYGAIDMSRVRVGIDVLACSKDPEAARKFARFVASARGREAFVSHGFTPAPEGIDRAGTAADGSLYLYCGAGLRPAVEEIVAAFLKRTGTKVEVDHAGSGILLSRIELAKRGDLFLPGEMEYVDRLAARGLVASRRAVAWLVPTILVKKGNPLGIRSPRDLVRPGVRLGLGNPEACQIGRTSEEIFRKAGVSLDAVRERTVFSSMTVNELGVQVESGQVDAAIVWEATAACHEKAAETVPIPPQENAPSRVGVAVLAFSEKKEPAEAFAAFLEGEEARAAFARHRYRVEPPEGAAPSSDGTPGATAAPARAEEAGEG